MIDITTPPASPSTPFVGRIRLPLAEARRTSASIGSKVGILPEVLADLTGPLGNRVQRGLTESRITARLGGSLQEFRDTWGLTKEEVAEIVSESW